MNEKKAFLQLLKPYEARPQLNSEFVGDFEQLQKHYSYLLKHEIAHSLIYEAGAKIEPYENEAFFNYDKICDLFGLTYTSSSDFAGLWNTNTQAKAKYGEPLYFTGIAQDNQNKAVFIFDRPRKNDFEQTYYFYENDFIIYQAEAEKLQRAIDYADYIKEANKIFAISIHILSKYEGKRLGEKTRDKINAELKAHIEGFKQIKGVYIDWSLWVKVYHNNYDWNLQSCAYILQDNTIKRGDFEPHYYKECDPIKVYFESKKQRQAIRETALKLQKQIEAYRENADRIHQAGEAVQSVYSVKLPYLVDGNF